MVENKYYILIHSRRMIAISWPNISGK